VTQAAAATCIAVGIITSAWMVLLWKKHPNGDSKWIPFFAVVSGLGLGIGCGALAGINIIQWRIGSIPVWVIFVAIVGFAFFLEMKGWERHRTRTPVLGFVTALILMLAVGQTVVGASLHELDQVRTTSQIVPAGTQNG